MSPHPAVTRLRPAVLVLLLTSLLAALLATASPPAAGGPATGGARSFSPATSPSAQSPQKAGYDLTLVTGDEVHVTVGSDGRQTATATAATRPDGSRPSFWIHRRGEDLYVVPDDMARLLPRRLDPMLFNVSALIEQGYASGAPGGSERARTTTADTSLPLIVTYRPGAQMQTKSVPTVGKARRLESVDGVAIRAGGDQTDRLRTALHRLAERPSHRTLTAGPFAGLDKIWLDRRTEVHLEDSVPQIGAPSVWEQGYDGSGVTVAVLDTGVDAEHPDLAGAVAAERNFTFGDSAEDGHGHGTHVASIAAGDGSASGGSRSGVAPGATVVSGKVLDNGGYGFASWLIDGMEWAAAERDADVVNMSLGFPPGSYGTGPVTEAVETLSEQTGALFVAAAGNAGCDMCIGAPGDAPSALTVGAVDDADDLADFSSRGPVPETYGLKPDITAPGVGIVAARAAGTSLGEPVDDSYTSLSGTSMAAPHVAGAAALLAQARPDLSGAEVKALLMGTAVPADDVSVYSQGAGRVDVAAAAGSPVLATPGSVDFGHFRYPHDQRAPVQRALTYTNSSDVPVTLDLSVTAQRERDGEPAPDGALTLSRSTLTVPAGGSAAVRLTLDTTLPGTGLYGGAVVATSSDGVSLRTPVGYHKEQEMYELHVEGVARDGRAAYGGFRVLDVVDGSVSATRYWRPGADGPCTDEPWAQTSCVRVPPGTYSVTGLVFTMPRWAASTEAPSPLGAYRNTSLVGDPEVTINGETTLTLDAREAEEVTIETPDHETKRNLGAAKQLRLHRAPEDGPAVSDGFVLNPGDQLEERLFVQPMGQVRHGELAAYSQWQLAAPAVTLDVTGTDDVALSPAYYDPVWFSDNSWQYPRLEGDHDLRVVDVGTATVREIDGRDLDGALALVRRSDDMAVAEQSNNAAAAGATMVAVYNDVPGSNGHPGGTGVRLQVPTVRLSHAEGTNLLGLTDQREVTVRAHGQPVSPYRYNLVFAEEGRIPQDLHYVADADELAAVRNDFHSQLSGDLTLSEAWFSLQPWEDFAMSVSLPTLGGPRSRTDYYVGGEGTAYAQSVTTPESAYNALWPQPPHAEINLQNERVSFEAGERVQQSWFEAPLRPGLWPLTPVQRAGNVMRVHMAAFVDGAGHFSNGYTSMFEAGFSTLFRMYADDELIEETRFLANGTIAVPEDADDFRIEYDVDNAAPWAKLSTHTRSVWTFGSSRPAAGEVRTEPLLTLGYDVEVDLHNRAPSPRERRGPHEVALTIGHQPGAPEVPIESASLWYSYDSGTTWRQAGNLRKAPDGRYVANLPMRAPKHNDGYVSLRVRAEDAHGNGIEQEVIRAYALPRR